MQCLFLILNGFVLAGTGNSASDGWCYLQTNDTVKLPCCHMRQAWDSLAISTFLLSLTVISENFSLSDYFLKKIIFWFFQKFDVVRLEN